MEVSILNNIGLKHGTDKTSEIHDYLQKYEKHIPYSRYSKIKILEIGVLNGASLKTWKEYFINSTIVGIDINPECKQYEEGDIKIEIGSQFDEKFLNDVCEKYGEFDLIIDDGSHINEHVIFSFEKLFGNLRKGGIYIVEDVGTSYWSDYGGSLKGEKTSIEYFKNIIDEVNYFGQILYHKHNVHARRDDWHEENYKNLGISNFGMYIESINFLNGIIIITKR